MIYIMTDQVRMHGRYHTLVRGSSAVLKRFHRHAPSARW